MKKNFFLDHPVFSVVISIVITIVGAIGLTMLPIDQYPDIVPPVVNVSASYPGADAMTVTQAVATPIEQVLNGTPGMIYMTSSSSNSGGFNANVTFDIGVDPELAAVDIQNRVKQAEARLPAEVVQNGISVQKTTAAKLMTVALQSSDTKYDEIYLSNFATLNVVDLVRRVPGVGGVSNVGSRYYAMLIHVAPDKLADMGITVGDIQSALKDQNRESAAGVLGQAPMDGVDLTVPIIARGRLSTVSEFEDIVLRANKDGSLLRLKDVAEVRLEAQSYSTESGINGGNAAIMEISMLPGANALDVAKEVKKLLAEIEKTLPEGLSFAIPFDMTTYISESIHHVYRTFFEALLLVILVVFLSLQNWRATLIPIIAVPISLIGTFGAMLVFGFSLNMLTLLGLILAIGIVVDDAIVVVENVDRIMNSRGLPPKEATREAMGGLSSALIAMSLVLCAVFVPVSFLPGITGQLYRQFTVTIAVSVIISTVVALTLSPVMCAALLRPEGKHRKPRFFRLINYWLRRGNEFYCRMVGRTYRHPRRMIAAFGLALVAIWVCNSVLPTSFMSAEDQGYFTVELELPEGATIERTRAVTDRAVAFLENDPDVEYVLNVTGSSPRMGTNQAHALLTVILKPWEERANGSLAALRERLRKEFSTYPESNVYFFSPAIIPGLGTSGGFEMVVEARADATYDNLRAAVDTILAIAATRPEFESLSSSMQSDIPQLFFDVDRDKAKLQGIPVSDIFSTMKAFTGSVYVNDFNMFNRIYRVYIQASPEFRARRENLGLFFVRGPGGVMVPVTSLGSSHFTTGPGTVARFNMFNAATISGEAAHGYSTGDAMEALQEIAAEHLPDNIGIEWSGLSYQQKHQSGNTGLVLGLALVFVFLFLAALYESWTVPLAVVLSLPVALLGAYLGIAVTGLENNIYFQIGLVMLVGLVAKNAILIVEFAKEADDAGMVPREAALTAARLRFRPIVMTSLAFMLGLLPLLVATGPGAAARRDIGTGVFFGMLIAITVGIVFVPFFYVGVRAAFGGKGNFRLFSRLRRKKSAKALASAAILLALASAATSCSGVKRCAPSALRVPDRIAGTAMNDSLTVADLEWWQVYAEPSLISIINETLEHNRDLEAARARMERMRELYGLAQANFLPTLSAQGYVDHETTDNRGDGVKKEPEAGLKATIAWEVDLWGGLSWAKKKAAADFQTSLETERALRMSLIADAATLYYTLIALDNELAIVRRTLTTRTEALRIARLRFEGGLTSEIVYRQAQVEYQTAAALVPGLEQRITAARNAITLLMGRFPQDELTRGRLDMDPSLPLGLPEDLASTLLERRPDVRAAEQSLRSSLAAVGVAYADRFPKLRLALTGGFEDDGFVRFFSSPWTYAVGSITGTILDFGRNKRKYRAAIADYDRAKAEYEKTVLAAFRDVSDAASAMRSRRQTTALRRELREAARRYVELAYIQYRAGSIGYIDVLDAQRRYFDAETGLSNAVRDEYLALVSLYKAIGGGWTATPHDN
ncbi:MAG: efflux RND transporter permease subunit [Muribaculaceae bacterium]|nr:efflux RND transporter permease subunit [Muribaculaceae bacterium]